MLRPDQPADPGIPEPAIRAQLKKILASKLFSRAKRLSRFLEFIVEEALAGRAAGLKEEVLARQLRGLQDFDSAVDPGIRVDARRLRLTLLEYYSESDGDQVIISVPKGGYAPEFSLNEEPAAAASPEGRWRAKVTYENAFMTSPPFVGPYSEIFDFEADGEELFGTATFRERPAAVFEGKIRGNRLSFRTKGVTSFGLQDMKMARHYRGKVLGDTIDFVVIVEGGNFAEVPIRFKAYRIPADEIAAERTEG